MTGNIVARRYAKALFAIGQAQGANELASYGNDLGELADILEASPEVLKVFKSPIFPTEKRKAVALALLEKSGGTDVVKNFVSLLADKDRLGFLPEIAAYYQEKLDETEGVLRGRMITAVPMAKKRQDTMTKSLEEKSGKKLVLEFDTNADIIGGVVLQIGDKVLDASLRAQLEQLKENIKRGE